MLKARERTRQAGARVLNEAIWLDGGNEDMPAVEGADPAVAVLVREQLRMFVRELPEAVELACQPDVSHVHPPVVIGRALRVIRKGGTVATAAAAVGVGEGAVYGWLYRLPAAREARQSLRRRGATGRRHSQRRTARAGRAGGVTVAPSPVLVELAERAARPDFETLQKQLRSSGYCARPIQLKGHVETCGGGRALALDLVDAHAAGRRAPQGVREPPRGRSARRAPSATARTPTT